MHSMFRVCFQTESSPLSGDCVTISLCASLNFGCLASLHQRNMRLSLVVRNAPASFILCSANILNEIRVQDYKILHHNKALI